VALLDENEEISRVFLMARRQIITIGQDNRPVDISIPAVKVVMDLFGVEDQVGCLTSVVRLWREVELKK